MDPKTLEKDIIELLGLENLPEEEKTKLISKMAETVLDRINLRILDALTEADKKKFDQLLKKNPSPQEVDKFLTAKIKNLEEIRMAEILRFKQDIVQDAEQIKNTIGK